MLLCGIVTLGALWDCAQRRIPNRLVLIGLGLGLGHALLDGGGVGLIDAIGGILTALAVLIWPFARGWLGGGDVKLIMVCGAFVGWKGVLTIVLWSTALNGLVSLAWLLARKWGHESKAVPFAVAVAGAVFILVTDAIPLPLPWT